MPISVNTGNVRCVVAVLFQEPHHGVFTGKVGVPSINIAACHHRAVVADLEGAPNGRALIEIGTTIGVVGLPGWIGGLKDHLSMAGVIAHNEGDVAAVAVILALQKRHVHAGNCCGRDRPGRRKAPGSAVVKLGCNIREALRLQLGQGS